MKSNLPLFCDCKALKVMGALILVALMLVAGSAFAQVPNPPPPPAAAATPGDGFFSNLGKNIADAVYYVVNSAIGPQFANSVKSAALGIAAQTTGAAYVLAAVLALASLLWKVIIDMLQRKSAIGSLLEVMIYSALAVALIGAYEEFVNQIWDIAYSLLSAISPGGPGEALVDYAMTFFNATGAAFKSISDNWADAGFWQASTMVLDTFGSIIMLIGIYIMMMLALVEVIGVFVMGPVFFSVGVVFGPLMLATLVSDYTRQWFGQWLNFMVGASMLTAVATTVLVLMSRVAGAAVTNLGNGGGGGMLTLVGIGILTLSLSKLFQAVPGITDAIFPGRTGAGSAIKTGVGASAIAGAAVGGAGLAMAGRAAMAAPSKVAGAVVAGLNAKTHLTNALNSAGGAMSSKLQGAASGAKNFMNDVRSSDAGKSITDLGRSAFNNGAKSSGSPPF